jgi:hypothetical protein
MFSRLFEIRQELDRGRTSLALSKTLGTDRGGALRQDFPLRFGHNGAAYSVRLSTPRLSLAFDSISRDRALGIETSMRGRMSRKSGGRFSDKDISAFTRVFDALCATQEDESIRRWRR